ncbi:peptidylprolyl isomerase [bacterium]|nr:peptidylprolyl isomerase [bacterium]
MAPHPCVRRRRRHERKQPMKHLVRLVWPLLLLVAVGAYAQAPADKPAAIVNGEVITQSQFLSALQARYGERVLRDMCGNLAIRQAAKAAGVSVTQEELERRFQATQAPIDARAPMTGETFATWLAKQALTPEAFVAGLYDQMLIEKMVEKQISVSDEDVARLYQANKEAVGEPAQVRVAHILVKTPEEAQALRTQITTGKTTWEEAAKKSSLDARTRENGGDMGFVPNGDTDFQKAAFALKAQNEISPPVQSAMGWHLLKRIGFKAARVPPFEEVGATLRDMLRRRQLMSLTLAKRTEILKGAKVESKVQFPSEGSPVPGAAPAPAQ